MALPFFQHWPGSCSASPSAEGVLSALRKDRDEDKLSKADTVIGLFENPAGHTPTPVPLLGPCVTAGLLVCSAMLGAYTQESVKYTRRSTLTSAQLPLLPMIPGEMPLRGTVTHFLSL